MLYIYRTKIKSGQLTKFHRWILANKKRLASSYPSNWRLKGVYLPVNSFGGLHIEIHWDVKNYAAFDELAASAPKLNGGILSGMQSFFDAEDLSEARLLKEVEDPSISLIGEELSKEEATYASA
jgi:hypothetical protein